MSDLTLTHSAELDVTQVEGNTEAGVEFVDGWVQGGLFVVDAGRIIVRGSDHLVVSAERLGLSVYETMVAAERAL